MTDEHIIVKTTAEYIDTANIIKIANTARQFAAWVEEHPDQKTTCDMELYVKDVMFLLKVLTAKFKKVNEVADAPH